MKQADTHTAKQESSALNYKQVKFMKVNVAWVSREPARLYLPLTPSQSSVPADCRRMESLEICVDSNV